MVAVLNCPAFFFDFMRFSKLGSAPLMRPLLMLAYITCSPFLSPYSFCIAALILAPFLDSGLISRTPHSLYPQSLAPPRCHELRGCGYRRSRPPRGLRW